MNDGKVRCRCENDQGRSEENKIMIIKNHAFGKKKWKIESGQIGRSLTLILISKRSMMYKI